jgi:hypothetical protein
VAVAEPRRSFRGVVRGRPVLLLAFAFAIMGDPVSSVAYAMEAGLRALGGVLALLLPTMALVLAIVAVVSVNYCQLFARFPEGAATPPPPRGHSARGWRSCRSHP